MLTWLCLDALNTGLISQANSRIDEAVEISLKAVEALSQRDGRQGQLVIGGRRATRAP